MQYFQMMLANLQFFHLCEEKKKDWGPGLTVSLTGQGEEVGQHLVEQVLCQVTGNISSKMVTFHHKKSRVSELAMVKPQNKEATISAPPLPNSQIFQDQNTT